MINLQNVPLIDRKVVNPTTGCWIFLGFIDPDGYGRVGSTVAHRVFYEAFVGPIPDGLQLDHLCVRRNCVNPEHMEPVTDIENARRTQMYRAPREWVTDACRRGHPYNDENTRYDIRRLPGGKEIQTRACRVCARISKQNRKASPIESATPRKDI